MCKCSLNNSVSFSLINICFVASPSKCKWRNLGMGISSVDAWEDERLVGDPLRRGRTLFTTGDPISRCDKRLLGVPVTPQPPPSPGDAILNWPKLYHPSPGDACSPVMTATTTHVTTFGACLPKKITEHTNTWMPVVMTWFVYTHTNNISFVVGSFSFFLYSCSWMPVDITSACGTRFSMSI